MAGHRIASLLKASPKGEGFHPSQIETLRQHGAQAQTLLQVFDAKKTRDLVEVAQSALEKDVRVYYFDRTKHATRDISELNVDEIGEGGQDGWGGLADFSSRVNQAVAQVVANSKLPF